MKKFIISSLPLFWVLSCVSFPSQTVRDIRPIPPASGHARSPASFEFRYFRPTELTQLLPGAGDAIRNSLLSTGSFSDVSVGRNDNMPYFEIRADEKLFGIPPFYGISYFFSAATLCLLPGYEHSNITLTVNVYKPKHVFYKQLKASGDKVTIFWFPFVLTGASDVYAVKDVTAYLMIDIVNQLRDDPLLSDDSQNPTVSQ